jgi:arylsulfatase A-like enzyme
MPGLMTKQNMLTFTDQSVLKPHLLVAMIDDLGWSGVGSDFSSKLQNGDKISPKLRALAFDGLRLERHYAYKFCSPSRSSFFSGRLPHRVNQVNLPPEAPGGGVPVEMRTIADILRHQGYRTILAGKWHLGMVSHGQLPISRGFDESLAMLGGGSDHFTNSIGFAVDLWLNDRPAHDVSRSNTSADERYTDFMVRAIETHDPNRPLFAWLSLQDVHEPLGQAPARFADKVGATFCAVSGHPIQCGWAMLAEADEMVGRVESALKGRGMWERTLMLVTSDNGGPATHESNAPLRGFKGTDFDGGVRVASFVVGGALPTAMRGHQTSGLIHVCDW